eukprot:945714-Amphidinium_carterae.1
MGSLRTVQSSEGQLMLLGAHLHEAFCQWVGCDNTGGAGVDVTPTNTLKVNSSTVKSFIESNPATPDWVKRKSVSGVKANKSLVFSVHFPSGAADDHRRWRQHPLVLNRVLEHVVYDEQLGQVYYVRSPQAPELPYSPKHGISSGSQVGLRYQ